MTICQCICHRDPSCGEAPPCCDGIRRAVTALIRRIELAQERIRR